MCGEWWYILPGEQIAIFSAEHDRFIKITYEEAAKADILGRLAKAKEVAKQAAVQRGGDAAAQQAAVDAVTAATITTDGKPIIIWRPFQTWTMASW
jgi:hypothetical protein